MLYIFLNGQAAL